MEHTYLYRISSWNATGTYYDAEGKQFKLHGETAVVRSEREWTLGGTMTVMCEPPVTFENSYTIHATDDKTTLIWESYNPALGVLKGKFEIVGDSIVSIYTSDSGVFKGSETLIKVDDDTYTNVGVAFKHGEKMSSWRALLKAVR
ncbi:hypothetical protein SAMN05660649_04602 [Desulfotomaculum arcticum]|uniref:Uncharacterized protein n=2 Tax=Desulfotruncus TaxID=2867377 RepID=A0A1I2YU20_9FIRM|nr:hypothetical protein SAMN05660649_04602 [Desulfotomaculum arcticum] [Desulfotruncus arcticus DSM 17038]